MAEDARYYTTVPNSLDKLLEKLPGFGTPDKVNSTWLASSGFGGGNNQSMTRVLKNVGLIGQDGSPTERWKAFKGGDASALAEGISQGYSGLFQLYPDAYRKDEEAILAWFRANTGLGADGQKLCVRTFQALVKHADFAGGTTGPTTTAAVAEAAKAAPARVATAAEAATASGIALTVNIQLQLPPSTDGEIYDKLFEAMAKHLRGLTGVE